MSFHLPAGNSQTKPAHGPSDEEQTTRCERTPPLTSQPLRDPAADDLLTPQNSALVVIDYQPSQVQTVHSIDRGR